MGEKPFRYQDSLPSKLDDKDITDQIRFQVSRNNTKEPQQKSKKIVWNPLSALLLDPIIGPSQWAQKVRYNKKINEGKLDEITDKEKLFFGRDTEKEVDIVADVAEGLVTGPPLAVKSLVEFLTIGADYAFDTNFTKKLDQVTRKFLKTTGEPETLAGEISQIGTQFLVPFKVIDKIIGNIGKLKGLKGKTLFMQNAKLANKNRFIQSGARSCPKNGNGCFIFRSYRLFNIWW